LLSPIITKVFGPLPVSHRNHKTQLRVWSQNQAQR
jgi:hypothetical protein